MGGDFAPRAPVAGALHALAEIDASHTVQLVGRTTVIEQELADLLGGELAHFAEHRDRIEIVEAPDVIESGDRPSAVIRGKPNSSMGVGLRLQVEGKSDAFVSAGNTGAQMAASALLLNLTSGRPGPPLGPPSPPPPNPIAVLAP